MTDVELTELERLAHQPTSIIHDTHWERDVARLITEVREQKALIAGWSGVWKGDA